MKDATDQNWNTAELASVSKVFTDGNWIETKDQASGGIRLVQTGNVGEGAFKDRRDKARWIDDETFDRLNCFEVLPGDCLVSRLPDPVGRACIIPETGDKMITAVDCTVIRPDETKIDSRFFVYYSLSLEYLRNVDDVCTGTTRRRISRKNLGKIPIPLPPLEEQQRIVTVLDEAFESLARARTHVEANLHNAQELFSASLRSLFADNREDWPLRNLAEVCSDFGRGKSKHRPRNDPRLYGGDTPFVQTGDLSRADHFLTEFTQTYSPEGVAQSRVWPKGTVCVAIVGATIGESAILDFEACFPDSVIGMIPDPEKSDPEFLDFLLQFVKAELKEAGKGSARDNINLGTFRDRTFPIPALDQQKAAVRRTFQLALRSKELEHEYRRKVEVIDTLRQSLLQKAFVGELT